MSNPTLAKLREGAAMARENDVDLILAVSGGSVITNARRSRRCAPGEAGARAEYYGRQVFLFGQGRDFADYRHIIGFHGSGSSIVSEHIYSYVIITYCYRERFCMDVDLGYERTYLSKFIRKATGSTFKQLVNVERMRRAALLLRDATRPIYEIAEEVGLANLTSFYQRFDEYAGMKPQAYRRQGS